MSPTLPQVSFDDTLAKTYFPTRVVKQALLVLAPEGVMTTIVPEWGGEQKFVGSWYGIYAAKQEFDEMHGRAGEVENGYVKEAPIQAYQYHGPDARVVTTLANGVKETENIVSDGKWLMRWINGEVGVIADEKIRKLYQID